MSTLHGIGVPGGIHIIPASRPAVDFQDSQKNSNIMYLMLPEVQGAAKNAGPTIHT